MTLRQKPAIRSSKFGLLADDLAAAKFKLSAEVDATCGCAVASLGLTSRRRAYRLRTFIPAFISLHIISSQSLGLDSSSTDDRSSFTRHF